ncbi:MAG: type 1 glutamine amidotransferase domain-containing protein [Chitinophagales bacterium]|nr:type 1 glutamine amidotransferase domain-containing protein [Chitinophagales bacterium]
MEKQLQHKRIAILVTNGFEEVEFTEPRTQLEEAGAELTVVTPDGEKVRAWNKKDWGGEYEADKALAAVSVDDYDGLVLPGGVMNPDKLRMNQEAVAFVRGFGEKGKPIAAICHGPWILIDAGIAEGRRVTSYPSLKTDLINAGAHWVDEEVVVDNGLVTSRKPDDLPAFCGKMLEEFAEGRHSPEEQAQQHYL